MVADGLMLHIKLLLSYWCWSTNITNSKHIFLGKCKITMAYGTSLKLGYKPEDFIMKIGPLIGNSELKDCILYTHTTVWPF